MVVCDAGAPAPHFYIFIALSSFNILKSNWSLIVALFHFFSSVIIVFIPAHIAILYTIADKEEKLIIIHVNRKIVQPQVIKHDSICLHISERAERKNEFIN